VPPALSVRRGALAWKVLSPALEGVGDGAGSDRGEQAWHSNGVEFRAPQPLRAARCRLNVMLLVLTTVISLLLPSPDDSHAAGPSQVPAEPLGGGHE